MLLRVVSALLLSLPLLAAAAGFPAGSECALLGSGDVVADFERLAALPPAALAGLTGQSFTVRVDEPVADRHDIEVLPDGRQRLVYRMGRNDVTEGWNWHPEADREREDYYHYKLFPLGQHEFETAPSHIEHDAAYGDFTVSHRRRDMYYIAFDNPYDFYPRNNADDGFSVVVPAGSVPPEPPAPLVQLVARGRYAAPYRSESNTYWRAIPAQPVDLWMKNRYFMGKLETLWFCTPEGRILGKLGK